MSFFTVAVVLETIIVSIIILINNHHPLVHLLALKSRKTMRPWEVMLRIGRPGLSCKICSKPLVNRVVGLIDERPRRLLFLMTVFTS